MREWFILWLSGVFRRNAMATLPISPEPERGPKGYSGPRQCALWAGFVR